MKTIYLCLIALLLLVNNLFSQYTNVRISNLYNPNEVSITISPYNTDIIVAGSNIFTVNSYSGYYYSSNGGLNWDGGILTSNVSRPSGDPVIIVDTNGYFYFIQNSGAPYFNVHLVQKSTDNGVTWSDGVTYGDTSKMQDKPWGDVLTYRTVCTETNGILRCTSTVNSREAPLFRPAVSKRVRTA